MSVLDQIREWRYKRASRKYNALTEYLNGLDPDTWPREFRLAAELRQGYANTAAKLHNRLHKEN